MTSHPVALGTEEVGILKVPPWLAKQWMNKAKGEAVGLIKVIETPNSQNSNNGLSSMRSDVSMGDADDNSQNANSQIPKLRGVNSQNYGQSRASRQRSMGDASMKTSRTDSIDSFRMKDIDDVGVNNNNNSSSNANSNGNINANSSPTSTNNPPSSGTMSQQLALNLMGIPEDRPQSLQLTENSSADQKTYLANLSAGARGSANSSASNIIPGGRGSATSSSSATSGNNSTETIEFHKVTSTAKLQPFDDDRVYREFLEQRRDGNKTAMKPIDRAPVKRTVPVIVAGDSTNANQNNTNSSTAQSPRPAAQGERPAKRARTGL